MKILGFEINRMKNAGFGVDMQVMKKSMVVEVVPPSRTAKDLSSYVQALRMAERPFSPQRYLLYDIYQESIDYDAHLKTVIEKRVGALLAKKFVYVSPRGKEIESVTEWIEAPEFRRFLRDLLETKFWGHSLFEFSPGKWFDYQMIPRKNVEPREGLVLKRTIDVTGTPYRTAKWQKTIMEAGEADDFGLLKTASRYAIYKRNLLSDWANYSELAGNNFEKFVYEGEDDKVKKEIDALMKQGGSGLRMRLPRDVSFEVQSASSSSTNALFENFHDIINKELSKLFLGQTMTTDGGQSRSQAEVHSEEQDLLLADDLIYILNELNYNFIDYVQLWGLPTGRFARKVEQADKPLVVEIGPAAVKEISEIVQSSMEDDQKIAVLRVLFNIDEGDAREMITRKEQPKQPEEKQEPINPPQKQEDDTSEDRQE